MEQRRLRLGDTLDDYCPRERRVTNHAVVAMIDETVKQTRCTTCDAEHEYKGARVPRRRKKETPSALFKEVLAGKPEDAPAVLAVPAAAVALPAAVVPVSANANAATETRPEVAPRVEPAVAPVVPPAVVEDPAPPAAVEEERQPTEEERPHPSEEWPMHRPLIRATLPRIEGQKEERRPPDFTIRQPLGRSGFRGDSRPKFRGHAGGNGNGNRAHGTARPGGGRPGGGGRGHAGRSGPSAGFRGGPPRHGGGKKRSR